MGYQLNFSALLDYQDLFLAGALMTLKLTLITIVGGFILGVLGAAARRNPNPALRAFAGFYVELFRNTPFIVQLFFIFFGMPHIHIKLTPIEAALIAMILHLGAYLTEIIRAGLEATPKGQIEAGRTLGFTKRQIFLRIVLPPALQRVYPSLVAQCILAMLGSAVISQISVQDLTYSAAFVQSRNFLSIESFLVAAVLYLILAFLLRQVFNLIGIYAFSRKEKRS